MTIPGTLLGEAPTGRTPFRGPALERQQPTRAVSSFSRRCDDEKAVVVVADRTGTAPGTPRTSG